jgi:hypothetical protein
MGLKKKVGEIISQVENQSSITRIIRNFSLLSVLNVMRERVLEVLYLIALFLFASGFINGLIEGSSPVAQNFLIFPRSGIQTLPETFIYLFTMLIGSTGVYLLYLGGRQNLRRRIADFYFVLGFSSVLIAVSFSLYIFAVKL